MATQIEISTIMQLIEECREKADSVVTNKETCYQLADGLYAFHETLSKVSPTDRSNAEKYRLQCVLRRIYRISTRAKVLFDKCRSSKLKIKIRNFFSTTTIKEEMLKLYGELPETMEMLNFVFCIKRPSALARGPSSLSPINESDFDEEREDDHVAAEDYYIEDED